MLKSKLFSKRRCGVMAALLAFAAAGAARAAAPDVLNQVPGDAYGVIVVNNVRALGTKIANAGTRLDLPVPPDPIGYVTRSAGITDGFDPNSSAALVLLKPGPDKADQSYFNNDNPPPAVGLIPTTNAKAMIAPFKPGDPDKDGISEVTLPDNPDQHGYVAVVANKWVAVAMKKEDLEAYLARGPSFVKTATPATLKVFDANDIVIWGDIAKLSAGSDKMLDEARTNTLGMLELQTQVGKGDPFEGAVAHAAVSAVFDFAKEFLKDNKAGMFTMRLTDSGGTFGISGDFKPDTPIGKFVAAQDGLGPITLQGLPGGNYLAAGTMKISPDSLKAPINYFIDQLTADPNMAKDTRLADLKKAFELTKQELALIQGGSFVMLDPAAGGKNGMFNGAFLLETSDPQKLLDLQMQSVRSALAQQAMSPDLKQTVTVAPDAVTIKGVSLNKVNIKVTLREETPDNPIAPENKVAADMAERMYGPEGITAYIGIVGKRMIVIYGSDAVTLESSIAAAQANTDDLGKTKEIAAMKDELVANPVAAVYLPIARWVNLAPLVVGPALGMPATAPAAAPAKAVPPMVMSVGVTGTTMTGELHMPIATIKGIQDAVKTLEEAMQAPPAGGDAPQPNLP